ncbi:hypothetical protein E4T44_01880 [Aureobasidium sp. EXF-8845]|nr:hypothetical protein E4T44_01880 [Aureobasidium sp. EXF-8845]KAI4856651.1 hypothetical protein E4T45_01877 [Aureobasidium sp. EXF-8846]
MHYSAILITALGTTAMTENILHSLFSDATSDIASKFGKATSAIELASTVYSMELENSLTSVTATATGQALSSYSSELSSIQSQASQVQASISGIESSVSVAATASKTATSAHSTGGAAAITAAPVAAAAGMAGAVVLAAAMM